MAHRLLLASLVALLGGCLIDPDVTVLYETSVDGPRGDGGTDLTADAPQPDAPLADGPLADGPAGDLPAGDLPATDAPAPDAAQPDAAQPDAAQPDATQPDLLQPDLFAPDLAAPPLGQGAARLLHAESTPTVLHRSWSEAAGFSAAATLLTPTKDVVWTVNQVSPTVSGEEAAMVFAWNAGGTELQALTRSAVGVWSTDWSSTAIGLADVGKRGFDLAYEQSSGDLLAVYSNNTDTPRFRTRVGGFWSTEQGVPLNDGGSNPNPDLNTGKVLWVELVSRPGSDQVALLYADANADLVAMVWDGSTWTTSTAAVLEANLKVNPNSAVVHQRCFDAAWEGQTGDLLAAWGRTNQDGYFSGYLSAQSGTWTSLPDFTNTSGEIEFVDLEGQAVNDYIVGTFMDQGNGIERLILAAWDGTQWINAAELDSQTRDVNDTAFGDAPSAVAWVDGLNAIAVYADNDTNVLDWAKWNLMTGWVIQSDATVFNKGYTESAQLAHIPGTSKVALVYSDDKSQLGWGVYDGSTAAWVFMPGWLSTDVSSLNSVPFSLAFRP